MKSNTNNLIAFGVDERIGARPENPRGGQIHLANEDSVTESNYSEPVTQYVLGWAQREDLAAVLDRICPPVEVSRRFEYKGAKKGESILSEVDDVRAVGADFKRVTYTGDSVNEKTQNKGLTIRLDRDNMPVGANVIERTAARLLRRIYRNELRRATTALLALDPGIAKVWGNAADPDMDIIDLVDAAGDDSGLDANVIIMGRGAWIMRQRSLRAQNKAGAMASASMTPADAAAIYGVDRVEVIASRYKAIKKGANAKLLGNFVCAVSLSEDPDMEDASNLKRFVSPTRQGATHAVYVDERDKYVDVSVELYSNIIGVTSAGAKRLNVSGS